MDRLATVVDDEGEGNVTLRRLGIREAETLLEGHRAEYGRTGCCMTRSNRRSPRRACRRTGPLRSHAERVARRLDADQDATLQLMTDEGPAGTF